MSSGPEIDLETCENVKGAEDAPPPVGFIKRLSMNHGIVSKPMTAVEVKLLELSLGRDHIQFSKEARFFLNYLESIISVVTFTATLAQHLLPEFHPRQTHYERMLWLICEVLEIYRDSGDLAIDGVLKLLCTERKVFQDIPAACNDPKLKLLIFSIIGWISMLFEPSHNGRVTTSFSIANPCPASSLRTNITIDKSRRPLDELLRAFGDLLPKRTTPDDSDDSSELTFQVSHLNANTLQSIGKLSITWVDSLSAHLLFDPASRSLYLFRLPSVCKMQQSDNSIVTILSQNLYVEGEEPGVDFSIPKVMGEILLSYALIFRDSRSSRIMYRNSERRRAAFEAVKMTYKVDPTLDELCGLNESKPSFSFNRPVRDLYDARTDFPIFKDRLKKVQLYMQGIQPNRTMSLWKDRRDLRLWYTIWIVVFLGAISIIQTFVSIGLAAAQLRVAQDAYDLQKKQGSY